jgi:diadenosine tetraphosphate (Ap4A) HIT family hydrolase
MTSFVLNPQLEADTQLIMDLPLCRALLMNNALFPWVILVPRVSKAQQITDLYPEQQATLMREIDRTSRALLAQFKPTRINLGALGNMVPQLHVHVIARFETDSAWPKPVWGMGSKPYTKSVIERTIHALQHALNQPESPLC